MPTCSSNLGYGADVNAALSRQEMDAGVHSAIRGTSRIRGRAAANIWPPVSKVIDSLAAGYSFSIVHLLEFENRRRILFK
jgi:hypothetical protein